MIVAIGSKEFLLGMSLAGIARTIESDAHTLLSKVRDSGAHLVVLDETLVRSLDGAAREAIETSIDPVVITLGGDAIGQLARMVHATLGVRLL